MKNILFFLSAICILFVTISCDTIRGATTEKKDVTGNIAVLTRYPDSITVNGKGLTYFVFHDLAHKRLLISGNQDILKKFRNWLPEMYVEGRSIEVGYTDIDPLSTFTKDELTELSKRLGVQLNEYKVARIMDWVFKKSGSSGTKTGWENLGQ